MSYKKVGAPGGEGPDHDLFAFGSSVISVETRGEVESASTIRRGGGPQAEDDPENVANTDPDGGTVEAEGKEQEGGEEGEEVEGVEGEEGEENQGGGEEKGEEEDGGGGDKEEASTEKDEEKEGSKEDEEEEHEGEEHDEGEEGSEGSEGEEDNPEQIAREILEMILADADDILQATKSIDSVILNELKEAEDRAQELSKLLVEKKEEIRKMKQKDPLSQSDIDKIKEMQLEIEEMVNEFEELAVKIKELLEKSLRPSSVPKPTVGVCPLCGKKECICQAPPAGREFECTCEEDVCTCKPEPYIPGLWLEQQVADLFPLYRETPVCICGSHPEVCVCEYLKEEEKECVCKKEDLAEFNIIADVMPKVVVCAPDYALPRIIVCEPYTPLKPKPKKPHVCERNRACKLYKYPGF